MPVRTRICSFSIMFICLFKSFFYFWIMYSTMKWCAYVEIILFSPSSILLFLYLFMFLTDLFLELLSTSGSACGSLFFLPPLRGFDDSSTKSSDEPPSEEGATDLRMTARLLLADGGASSASCSSSSCCSCCCGLSFPLLRRISSGSKIALGRRNEMEKKCETTIVVASHLQFTTSQ